MTVLTMEDWQARIAEHFRKLERTGGDGYLKAGMVFLTREHFGDMTQENRETFDQAVADFVDKGYVEIVRSQFSPIGFDIAVTVDGISAFI